MSLRRRPSSLSLAALLLLGLGAFGAVEHQVVAASPGSDYDAEHLASGHSDADSSLHLDPATPRPHHDCLGCWLGSKSRVSAGVARVEPPLRVAVVLRPSAPDPAGGWLDSAPSRGPPVS